MQAFKYIKESTTQQVLSQVWAPVKMGTQYFLTTAGQPFIVTVENHGLTQYRLLSLGYLFPFFPVGDDLGLPGRVFLIKLPEWTPNAQYYSTKEYPQLNDALHCNVRGILALPLFYSGACIGVLELVMTTQKINYASEFDLVCKALEVSSVPNSLVNIVLYAALQLLQNIEPAYFFTSLRILVLLNRVST